MEEREKREAGRVGKRAKHRPSSLPCITDKAGRAAPRPTPTSLSLSWRLGAQSPSEPDAHAPGLGDAQAGRPAGAGTSSAWQPTARAQNRCTEVCGPTAPLCPSRSCCGKPPPRNCRPAAFRRIIIITDGCSYWHRAENYNVAIGTWLTLPQTPSCFDCSGNTPGALFNSNKELLPHPTFGDTLDQSGLSKSLSSLLHERKLGCSLRKTNTSREVIKCRLSQGEN